MDTDNIFVKFAKTALDPAFSASGETKGIFSLRILKEMNKILDDYFGRWLDTSIYTDDCRGKDVKNITKCSCCGSWYLKDEK